VVSELEIGEGHRVLCRLRCFRNHGDNLADRHVISGFCADGGKKSVGHGLDFHHRLVGLDLHQRIAGFHRIAGLFSQDTIRPVSCAMPSAGMMTSCGIDQLPGDQATLAGICGHALRVGTVRSSSAGLKGTGTSIAPMRSTGASRW
jgi:hypothetical protein